MTKSLKMSLEIVAIGEMLWDMFPDGPRFGGAPANVACAIAGLLGNTTKVSMLSAVGDDLLGSKAVELISQRGIDTSKVQTTAYATGKVTVSLNASGQASYLISENSAWDNLTWLTSWNELAANTKAICFGSLAQRHEISRFAIQKFIRNVPKNALKVFDVNLRAPFYNAEIIIQSLELANVLKLNEEELPIIADILNISGDNQQLLQTIKQQFQLSFIAFTQGADGAILINANEQVQVPIVPTTVVDTVGAGDSFTAALTIGLLQNKSLKEIGHFATKVSAYVCSQRGGTPPLSLSIINQEA